MKKLLCKIYGHRTSGDEYLGQEYLTVHPETVDGIGRWHATIETECKRCGEVFRVGKIHIPQKLVNVDQRVMLNFADRVRLTDGQLNDVYDMVKQWTDEKSKDRAIEELLELSLSLLHLARNKTDLESLHKEMADVRLALEHLEFKFGNYQKELNGKLAHNSKISA